MRVLDVNIELIVGQEAFEAHKALVLSCRRIMDTGHVTLEMHIGIVTEWTQIAFKWSLWARLTHLLHNFEWKFGLCVYDP